MEDFTRTSSQLKKTRVRRKDGGWRAFFITLVGLGILFLLMAFSISKGAVEIPLSSVWEALVSFDQNNGHHLIILDIRLPRVIASALVGSALAVSGAIMQGVTRNPMADSGLLGINAGAGFALSLCFAFFPEMRYIEIIFFSFLGAAMGAGLVNGIASSRGGRSSPIRLVLAGAAVTALLSSLSQGIALYFDVAQDLMFWTVGGVAGSNWQQVGIILPVIMVALLAAIILAPYISILSLGEEMARGLGLNTILINIFSSIIVVVLAGVSVSVVGAVGFVGLIIPHLSRYLVGVDYRHVIPVSAVLGGILVLAADLGSRTLRPPTEVPIGPLIALLGVPFLLYLAARERRAY